MSNESEQSRLEKEERMRRALLSILEDEQLAKQKVKASEEALKESQRRLQSLSAHLLEAQEKKWRHIALELHDELGQSLSMLKLQLRDIKKNLLPDSVLLNAKCDDANKYLDYIINNVRRLSQELCPSCIEDLGLDESIIILAEEFAEHTELQIAFTAHKINDFFNLQERTFIYRIIQESLNNIQKHAKAHKASIIIEKTESHIKIQIADDGIGFNNKGHKVPNEYKSGLGLTAMEERARMLGGRLQVYSIKGTGTQIEVKIPIDGKARKDDLSWGV
jgi:signal transduction histidine kinase